VTAEAVERQKSSLFGEFRVFRRRATAGFFVV
jgi:hypothetical protein